MLNYSVCITVHFQLCLKCRISIKLRRQFSKRLVSVFITLFRYLWWAHSKFYRFLGVKIYLIYHAILPLLLYCLERKAIIHRLSYFSLMAKLDCLLKDFRFTTKMYHHFLIFIQNKGTVTHISYNILYLKM